MAADATAREQAYQAERRIAGVRLLVVLSGFVLYPLMDPAGTIPVLAYGLLVAALLYSGYVWWFEPYRSWPVLASSYYLTVTDSMATLAWLYATGGFHSPFFIAMYLAIFGAAFRFPGRETAVATLAYGAGYGALVAALGQWAGNEAVMAVRLVYLGLAAAFGIVIAREVTAQARTRAGMQERVLAARRAENRARNMMEAAPDPMLVVDAAGRISLVNTATERAFRADRSRILGSHIGRWLPAAEGWRDLDPDDLSPELHGVQWNAARADGTEFPAEIRASPVTNEDGRFLTLAVRDVTEREQARSVLEANQADLAEAQRVAQLGSWAWDVVEDKVRWSDEMYRILGLEANVRPGYAALIERVHPEDREAVEQAVGRALLEVGRFQEEFRIVRPDGGLRWLRAIGHAEPAADGSASRMSGTAQDVTQARLDEEQRLESQQALDELERLREINRFKSQFLNTAAHELSTPLTPMRLQVHLLRQTHARLSDRERDESIEIVERNVERLIHLVGDLMEAGRLQAGRLGISKKPTDLVQVARETMESFQATAKQTRVILEMSGDAALEVEADPKRMGQVLFNLVSNAIKFTPSGGRVRVTVAHSDNAAEVRVTDEGIGLNKEQIARLFQPFTQVHEEAPRKVAGTGLGLFISRGLVELHGGKLWAESPGRGKGSTFAFVIPRDAARANPWAAAAKKPVPQSA